MSHHQKTKLCSVAAAAFLTLGLSGCMAGQSTSAESEFSKHPAPSDQTVAEACSLSLDTLSNISTEAQDELTAAAGSLAAGEIPDLQPMAETLRDTLITVQDGVSNPEVLSIVQSTGKSLERFAALETPTSLIGAPGYLAELGGLAKEITTSVEQIRALCI